MKCDDCRIDCPYTDWYKDEMAKQNGDDWICDMFDSEQAIYMTHKPTCGCGNNKYGFGKDNIIYCDQCGKARWKLIKYEE